MKIAGMIGRRSGLERELYSRLSNEHLEAEDGLKIFMFHSAVEELKQDGFSQIDAVGASFFPRDFFYYAGGHVHIVEHADVDCRKNIVFPGPTFPNNFSEVEKLGCGSFCIVENGKIEHVRLSLHPVVCARIDCSGKNALEIARLMEEHFEAVDVGNAIVCLRLEGKMKDSKVSDVDFRKVFFGLESKGAYFVMKNSNGLSDSEFEEVKVCQDCSENIEEKIIDEHLSQSQLVCRDVDARIVRVLLKELCAEKNEAEKVGDFERRFVGAVDESVLADFFRLFFSK